MQLLSGVNRSLLTILAETLETEHAALLGVESIVRADTDVDARMDVGAALAHKNVAGENELTVSALGAKALGVRVAAVLRGAAALLVGEELKTKRAASNPLKEPDRCSRSWRTDRRGAGIPQRRSVRGP